MSDVERITARNHDRARMEEAFRRMQQRPPHEWGVSIISYAANFVYLRRPKGRRFSCRESGMGFVTPEGVTPYPHAQRAGNVSAPFSLRGKEKAAGGKKKTPKGDFDFPLWNPLKTTKKRADAPFLDHSRGLVGAKQISNQQKTRCRCELNRPAR